MLNTNILNINPEIVTNIIEKAKEFQAKESVSFPEETPDSEYESDWSQILADHKDDATFSEVEYLINDLEPDQQVDLLTLMYVGRGDFDIDDWSQARKLAKDNLAPGLTHYLLSKPQIVEYLEEALNALGYSDEDE